MKKLPILFLLIFITGCNLSPEMISKNPKLALNECNKIEDLNEQNTCIGDYAKAVALVSKEAAVELCNNLEDYQRNKCLFDVFSKLEENGQINNAIEVCKLIEKEDYQEWCESRRNRESISVAPSLI